MMNLQGHIKRYLELVERCDNIFASIKHGDLPACKPNCDDCCRVYFQLSLVEAFYVNGMFLQQTDTAERSRALIRAEGAIRAFKEATAALSADRKKDLSLEAAKISIPCPLNEDGGCLMYEHRPITCRLYGIPQKIGPRVVSCHKSGFETGSRYQTVNVDEIQGALLRYSREFLQDLTGKKFKTPPPFFSLGAALHTRFDREFFLCLADAHRR